MSKNARLAVAAAILLTMTLNSCSATIDAFGKRQGVASARVNLPPLPDDCRVKEKHAEVRPGLDGLSALKRERLALDRANSRVERCAGNYDNVARTFR